MDKWHDSDNPSTVVRGATWRGMIWVLALILFFSLIGIAFWGFGVFSSPLKGKGDAYQQKNSAQNRIAAQARFEDLYADIQATDRKLDQAKADLDADPDSQIKQTNFTGLTNYCNDVVGDYNAESRKYLAEDFKSWDLPPQIDMLNPATDCKPN